ncbi:MAG: mechanosensitive ion channel family protein [Gemmatimonadota bacterium]|jgi:small-conductance mechanosensitive channel
MDSAFWTERLFWENTPLQWLSAAGVALLVVVGLQLVITLLVRRSRGLAARTGSQIDDLLVDLLSRTKVLFVILVALWVAGRALSLTPGARDALRSLLVLGFLLQVGFWGTAFIRYGLERYRRKQLEVDPGGAMALGALHFLAQAVLWTMVVLTALANLGVDITAFVASLGLGGIAVALALQNVLSDLFASLSIVLDKPFVIGDFIIVGDMMGTVENVGLKTTRVRSLSGEQLVFSNSDLLSSRIRNYKRMQERRAVFSFGVVYGTPAEKLERIPEIVREAIEARENTRFDRSHFKEYGASSLDFETVYYMTVPDFNAYMDTQQAINLRLYEAFREQGIDFAFPTRTVHLDRGADGSPLFHDPGGATR